MTEFARYDSLFQYYAEKYKLSWTILKSQAIVESNLNPDVSSPVGAKGLCQFMDATWVDMIPDVKHRSVWNPEHAIHAQATYMKSLWTECKGLELTLAAYNWGIGRVRCTFLIPGLAYDPNLVPKETRDYVARILS